MHKIYHLVKLMKFFKKSLGQNLLIEKNVINKILDLAKFKNKDVVEIGPGKGALTDEIIRKKPKSLTLIEKDDNFKDYLTKKYLNNESVIIINKDVLKFNFAQIKKNNAIIIGNLPYNISSQILVKILKINDLNKKFSDLIFMFQKELGNKIIANYPSKNYGRLSIITKLKLKVMKYFLVSPNCFFPKPKVTSMIIHFKTLKENISKIKKVSNLEKITNILFSNRRKMINKNIKKILSVKKLSKIPDLNTKLRAENINPRIFYKITELFEKS